jgi:hypothetical protein
VDGALLSDERDPDVDDAVVLSRDDGTVEDLALGVPDPSQRGDLEERRLLGNIEGGDVFYVR